MSDEHLQAMFSVRGVVIESRGQIPVLQRATSTEWELPGGRLTSNEAPLQKLHRELTEETALPVEVGEIVAASS